MNNNILFNNYKLTNRDIEHVLCQMEHYINVNSFVNGKFDEDLNQEIKIKIFRVLSKNRKRFKNF